MSTPEKLQDDTPEGDGPDKSPDGLGFKTRPTGITTVNKKAVVVGITALTVVLGAIAIGVVTKKPSTPKAAASIDSEATNKQLSAATQAGDKISAEVPEGNLPLRSQETAGVLISPPSGQNSPPQGELPPLNPAAPPLLPTQQEQLQQRPGQANVDPKIEQQRRLREEKLAKLKQAMDAPTTASSSLGSSQSAMNMAGTNATAGSGLLQQLAAAASQGRPAQLGMAGGGGEEDQNMQAKKLDFIKAMESVPDRNHVNSTRKAPISPYEVKAGWVIPAALEHGINSDLPGKITAKVTQNVWDTATGRFLLIPQGATLLGAYDSQVAYGQNGLLVVWRRIIYPDGSSFDLEGMMGVDESGYAGFRDEVNNHYGRIFGFGIMTSLLTAAFQLSQDQQPIGATPTPSQTAAAAVSQQMSQLGIEMARKNMKIQPTIEIRPGYRFNVRVDKDLIFGRPYAVQSGQLQ